MRIISGFDRNPQPIGLKSTYTTLIGSLFGIIATIVLIAIGVTKIISVLNYETLYLNYWRTEEAWDVPLDDVFFQVQINGGFGVGKDGR